jgi:hypothetical protein
VLEALGAGPDEDVLVVLQTRYAGKGTRELEELLEAHAIPSEFWNRIGD